MYEPLNPYEQFELCGPPEYDDICELCGCVIDDEPFYWRGRAICCEECYRELLTDGGN